MVTTRAAATEHVRRAAMGSTMEKIKGRLKEAVSVLMDNHLLKRAGQRDQGMGEVQDKAERAVEKTRDA
jgi:uncharacterized protein YjbJ (UPF0337 family)